MGAQAFFCANTAELLGVRSVAEHYARDMRKAKMLRKPMSISIAHVNTPRPQQLESKAAEIGRQEVG